jgi:hypothetical protein
MLITWVSLWSVRLYILHVTLVTLKTMYTITGYFNILADKWKCLVKNVPLFQLSINFKFWTRKHTTSDTVSIINTAWWVLQIPRRQLCVLLFGVLATIRHTGQTTAPSPKVWSIQLLQPMCNSFKAEGRLHFSNYRTGNGTTAETYRFPPHTKWTPPPPNTFGSEYPNGFHFHYILGRGGQVLFSYVLLTLLCIIVFCVLYILY